jgi:hypothetical protein
MKTILKTTMLFLATLTLSCCNKDDNPFSGNDQLPPETQTGANTVGCLVNGKVYLPSQRGLNTPVNCYYQLDNGEFYFALGFADNKNYGPQVMVNTRKITLQTGNIYILNKNMVNDGDFIGGGGAFWNDPANISYTNTIKQGELKITKLDLANSIISGTFWFDAVNTAGETVEIRQGRFDWNY